MPPGSSLQALHGVRRLISRSQPVSPNGNPFSRKIIPAQAGIHPANCRTCLAYGLVPFFAGIACDRQNFSWQMAPRPRSNYGNDHTHRQARKNLTHELALRIVKLSGGIRDIHCK
jgi:hypothetical protein